MIFDGLERCEAAGGGPLRAPCVPPSVRDPNLCVQVVCVLVRLLLNSVRAAGVLSRVGYGVCLQQGAFFSLPFLRYFVLLGLCLDFVLVCVLRLVLCWSCSFCRWGDLLMHLA